ncbi:DUF2798 domain-containing protein [Roseomonas sp. CAU 1739]|uniref:DUF2798 domain-containing protein n=1 Tax=Roseomonas sp. CAU 1739 TaxID=3140364 RepID=UPI00325A8AA2
MTTLPRIPARYAGIVMPLLLSVIMTCIISGVSTFLAIGFSRDALRAWPVGWAMSWIVAFPTLLVVLPIVRHLVSVLVAPPTR